MEGRQDRMVLLQFFTIPFQSYSHGQDNMLLRQTSCINPLMYQASSSSQKLKMATSPEAVARLLHKPTKNAASLWIAKWTGCLKRRAALIGSCGEAITQMDHLSWSSHKREVQLNWGMRVCVLSCVCGKGNSLRHFPPLKPALPTQDQLGADVRGWVCYLQTAAATSVKCFYHTLSLNPSQALSCKRTRRKLKQEGCCAESSPAGNKILLS